MFPHSDTIAAIATPIGQGGIGIIRVSGPRAHMIARALFRPKNPASSLASHRLYYGHIVDPASGDVLDEVLLSAMRAPRSYTREDLTEIHSHSGHAVLTKVMQMVLRAGARPALPGEFTLRAFLNGRIDLTQAEAVMDLINARSEKGLHLASRQIQGGLGEAIESLRNEALSILANVEASIDFPEEDGVGFEPGDLAAGIRRTLLAPVRDLIVAHARRRVWVDGLVTVIAGRVNVGKSSLLNRLLEEERAIVTPQPGTTRDVIEATLNLDGLPLRLMDTAGLRRARNEAERIGLGRTREKLDEADLVLLVIDQSRPLGTEDMRLLDQCRGRNLLVVLNKIDLPRKIGRMADGKLQGLPVAKVSALTGDGMRELQQAVKQCVLGSETETAFSGIAPNLRHKRLLEKALEAFVNALQSVERSLPLEIAALELQSGIDALGEIVGAVPHEALLHEIFSRFCIGK